LIEKFAIFGENDDFRVVEILRFVHWQVDVFAFCECVSFLARRIP